MSCWAVLDRTAGIQELGLAQDRAAGFFGSAAQFDQWRIADSADEPVADLHALPPTYVQRMPPFDGRLPTISAGKEREQAGRGVHSHGCLRRGRLPREKRYG